MKMIYSCPHTPLHDQSEMNHIKPQDRHWHLYWLATHLTLSRSQGLLLPILFMLQGRILGQSPQLKTEGVPAEKSRYTVKKGQRFFYPQPGCHLSTLPGQELLNFSPARESLVSDITAGDGGRGGGETDNIFNSVLVGRVYREQSPLLKSRGYGIQSIWESSLVI